MKPSPLDQGVAHAVLEMTRERSLTAAMERVVAMVTEVVSAADAAAVMLWTRSLPAGPVTTDEAVQELVDRHLAIGSTPALSVCETGRAVYSADLSRETRWPAFSADMATSLGIHSVLAVPLAIDKTLLGTLAIYAKTVDAFDPEDREVAEVVAIHATAALADALERQHLSQGLATRTVIGQATGIVMQQFGIDATTAFAVLRRLSQHHNEKVRDLAARIVDTRVVR
jgi:transcriptional regulator with GAF, ATPase, and Fis domain